MWKAFFIFVFLCGLFAPLVTWSFAIRDIARRYQAESEEREQTHLMHLRTIGDLDRLHQIATRHGLIVYGEPGYLIDHTPPTSEGRFEKRWAELIEALRIQGVTVERRDDGTLLVGPFVETKPSVKPVPPKMPEAEREQLEKLQGIRR